MTLDGTNTYVVDGYVIDPGPDDPDHLKRVREAAGGAIAGVLLTHGHSDHSAGVEALGAKVVWGRASGEDEMQALAAALEAGSAAGIDELVPHTENNSSVPPEIGPFTVIATPGHAADHACFVRDDVCFCGDLILGSGSTIVPPAAGGGSLADYMASLDRVETLGANLLAPGHGPWITDPEKRIAEYREHRLDRERRLVAALERGERSRAALPAEVWDDVPEVLRQAAAIAMQAHLEKLAAEGRLVPGELID
jgi:glyoxylase-like metal-dependent hydrolase (beta-lactamase superfamily II)